MVQATMLVDPLIAVIINEDISAEGVSVIIGCHDDSRLTGSNREPDRYDNCWLQGKLWFSSFGSWLPGGDLKLFGQKSSLVVFCLR